jgi:hypothetical protein
MAFGIAKGFGFEKMLEEQLRDKLAGHEDILANVIQFSHSLLQNTQGGLIAGVGLIILFWSVLKVLGQIENSFNDIWGDQGAADDRPDVRGLPLPHADLSRSHHYFRQRDRLHHDPSDPDYGKSRHPRKPQFSGVPIAETAALYPSLGSFHLSLYFHAEYEVWTAPLRLDRLG